MTLLSLTYNVLLYPGYETTAAFILPAETLIFPLILQHHSLPWICERFQTLELAGTDHGSMDECIRILWLGCTAPRQPISSTHLWEGMIFLSSTRKRHNCPDLNGDILYRSHSFWSGSICCKICYVMRGKHSHYLPHLRSEASGHVVIPRRGGMADWWTVALLPQQVPPPPEVEYPGEAQLG